MPPVAPTERPPGTRSQKVGFDYVHSLVDDYSRLAYSQILPDEKGDTCADFLNRAIAHFASTASPASSG